MTPTTPRTASLSLSRSKSGRPQRQHWHRRTFTNYIKRQESGGKGKGDAGAVDDAAAGASAVPAAGSAGAKKASSPKDHPHFVWILWGSFVLTINAGFIVSPVARVVSCMWGSKLYGRTQPSTPSRIPHTFFPPPKHRTPSRYTRCTVCPAPTLRVSGPSH